MRSRANNYAYIDSQNLNLGVLKLGWKIDYRKFRIYLKEKYQVSVAYMFIGYVEDNEDLYENLRQAGFEIKFKPTVKDRFGNIKGNVDADLVLQAMIDYGRYDKAILISGDGDFYSLGEYLIENEKLLAILIPNRREFSSLLRRNLFRIYLRFIDDLSDKLQYIKEKAP